MRVLYHLVVIKGEFAPPNPDLSRLVILVIQGQLVTCLPQFGSVPAIGPIGTIDVDDDEFDQIGREVKSTDAFRELAAQVPDAQRVLTGATVRALLTGGTGWADSDYVPTTPFIVLTALG
jgi:molybdopterin biosynthesis enzyme MoaB